MTDRPYTDADLRAEAARQLSAHGSGITPEQTYAAMLDARIDSTRDEDDGPTWSQALGAPELNAPALAVHALIKGAADVTGWAVGLSADGLEPSPDEINLDADAGPFVRIHFAFNPAMALRDRQRFALGVQRAIAEAL